MNYLKGIFILFIIGICFTITNHPAYANIPDIEGYVLVSGTNAPVPDVWVKITNDAVNDSNCVSGAINQSRYAKTDANGKYTFVSWNNGGSSAVGEGVRIDSNRDGALDVIEYPTFDSCEGGTSPGSVFSCGRDPFSFEVIRPVAWFGTFDSIAKTDAQGNCLFCINNGTFTAVAPTLYYHPPIRTTLTPTRSTATATVTPGNRTSGTPTSVLSPSPTVTPTGAPSCSFSSIPPSKTIPIGTADFLTFGINQTGGAVDQITFTSDNGNVVSVCRSPLCSIGSTFAQNSTAQIGLTGFVVGQSTKIHITGKMLASGVTCTPADITIGVVDVGSWCQFKGTDAITNGNIACIVPTTCTTAGGCANSLMTYDPSQSPGLPIAGGSIDPGSGSISKPKPPYGWSARTRYSGVNYSYDYFEKKAGDVPITTLAFPRINDVTDLTTGTSADGYYWNRYSGGADIEIIGDIEVGSKKIVLFVNNADIVMKGKIHVTKGKGFFMLISSGNIRIDPSVGAQVTQSDIEGVYFTDKQFDIPSNGPYTDKELKVRGAVVAMDKIVMERSLTNNSLKPAETFEYGPDQLLLFPWRLGESQLNWKEVAP